MRSSDISSVSDQWGNSNILTNEDISGIFLMDEGTSVALMNEYISSDLDIEIARVYG